MSVICKALAVLCVAVLLSACTTTPKEHNPKVHCPACNSEVDALFQKRF